MPALSCPRCCSAYRPEVGEVGGLRMSEDSEDAALFLELVEHRAPSVYGLRRTGRARNIDRSRVAQIRSASIERLVERRGVRRSRCECDRRPPGRQRSPEHPPPAPRRAAHPHGPAPPKRSTRDADSPNSVAMSPNDGALAATAATSVSDAEAGVERRLRERHREAAFRAVVRRTDQPARRRPRRAGAAAPPRAADRALAERPESARA